MFETVESLPAEVLCADTLSRGNTAEKRRKKSAIPRPGKEKTGQDRTGGHVKKEEAKKSRWHTGDDVSCLCFHSQTGDITLHLQLLHHNVPQEHILGQNNNLMHVIIYCQRPSITDKTVKDNMQYSSEWTIILEKLVTSFCCVVFVVMSYQLWSSPITGIPSNTPASNVTSSSRHPQTCFQGLDSKPAGGQKQPVTVSLQQYAQTLTSATDH